MPGVEVAVTPEELESLDDDALKQLYEQRAQQASEALGEAVAQQASQKRKASKLESKEKKFKF